MVPSDHASPYGRLSPNSLSDGCALPIRPLRDQSAIQKKCNADSPVIRPQHRANRTQRARALEHEMTQGYDEVDSNMYSRGQTRLRSQRCDVMEYEVWEVIRKQENEVEEQQGNSDDVGMKDLELPQAVHTKEEHRNEGLERGMCEQAPRTPENQMICVALDRDMSVCLPREDDPKGDGRLDFFELPRSRGHRQESKQCVRYCSSIIS